MTTTRRRLTHRALPPTGHDLENGRGFSHFDLALEPEVQVADFLPAHHRLSSSAESPFVNVVALIRRTATECFYLKRCVLTRVSGSADTVGAEAEETVLEDEGAWLGALREVFDVELPDDVGSRLFQRVKADHDAFVSATREPGAARTALL